MSDIPKDMARRGTCFVCHNKVRLNIDTGNVGEHGPRPDKVGGGLAKTKQIHGTLLCAGGGVPPMELLRTLVAISRIGTNG